MEPPTITTVKELKEVLSQYSDDMVVLGLYPDGQKRGAQMGGVKVFQAPGGVDILCISITGAAGSVVNPEE